jgi:hypothetical protein
MFGFLGGFLANLFSSSKAQDLAIDGIRKIGGLNEMTPKEKSQYILDYMAATKHQSPIRRLIAFLLTFMYVSVIVVWLVSAGFGFIGDSVPALEFAGQVKVFMTDVIVQPFNIILSFYFVTQIAGKFGGK